MGNRCYLSLLVCMLSAPVTTLDNCEGNFLTRKIPALSFYQTYFTPNYNTTGDYGRGISVNCESIIFQASCTLDETVQIRVLDVNLLGKCTDDKITFYDGSSPIFSNKLDTVCGLTVPNYVIESTRCQLLMTLQTGLHSSATVRKMRLQYRSVIKTDNNVNSYRRDLVGDQKVLIIILGSLVGLCSISTIIFLFLYCYVCRRKSVPEPSIIYQQMPSVPLQTTQEQVTSLTAPSLDQAGTTPAQHDDCPATQH